MYVIEKIIKFESAHRLPGHPKCGNLHGHSYKVEVVVESEQLNEQGFVIDFGVLSKIVKGSYDHSGTVINLSAEKLAKKIHQTIKNKLEFPVKKIGIKVWETESSVAKYTE